MNTVHDNNHDKKIIELIQAAILVEPTPVNPSNNQTVSILLHHQQGILDFEVHC
jgi:hypothetical protein